MTQTLPPSSQKTNPLWEKWDKIDNSKKCTHCGAECISRCPHCLKYLCLKQACGTIHENGCPQYKESTNSEEGV